MSLSSSSVISELSQPRAIAGVPKEILVNISETSEAVAATSEAEVNIVASESANKGPPASSVERDNTIPLPQRAAKSSQPRAARAMKPLPEALQSFGVKDLDKIHCQVVLCKIDANSDPAEVNLAQYIEIDGKRIDLNIKKDLVVDQMRKLCRNVGCKGTHSASHVKCQKALATLKTYNDALREKGVHAGMVEARALNGLLKAVNVVFSTDFYDRFLNVNGPRDRSDHETHNMPSDFWKDAADHYNLTDFDDDDDEKYTLVVPNTGDPMYDDLQELLRDPMVDLQNTDPISDKVLKVRINTLFKIRRCIKKNMTQSGTHSNRHLDFVDVAMNTVKGGRAFHRTGVFYFYCRCESHGESLDAAHSPRLDENLKSDTAGLSDITDQPNSRKRKNEAAAAMERVADSNDKMGLTMEETNKVLKEHRIDTNANFEKISSEMKRVNDALLIKIKYDTAVRAGKKDLAEKLLGQLLEE